MAAKYCAYTLVGVVAALLADHAFGAGFPTGSGTSSTGSGTSYSGSTGSGTSSTVRGDPVFTGFDNSTFEFLGNAGSNYSVLSSKGVTVNMGLVEDGPLHHKYTEGEGTFVGSLAVLLPAAALELVAQVSEAGNMTCTMEGAEMDIAAPWAEGVVEYEPYRPGLGQVITISSSPFKITVVAVKQHTDKISGYNRGHLDLSVELTGPVGSVVAGAMGQTLYGSNKADESSFQIPYLTYLPSIVPEVAISSSRRLLSLKGPFPMHAGLSARVTNMGA